MPNKKSTSIKKSNWKRWALWIVPLTILLAGYVAWSSWVSPMIEQSKMTTYLKEKYGEEFVVGGAIYKNSGLGVKGIWEAEAYPKDDSALKFRVGASEYDFSDQYMAAIWSKEATPEFKKYVSSVYNDKKIDASVQIVLSDNLVDNATKTNPSLEEAKAMENGFLYKAVIVRKQGDEAHIANEALLASRLLALIGESGVNKRSLDYTLETKSGVVNRCEIFSSDSTLSIEAIEACIKRGRA